MDKMLFSLFFFQIFVVGCVFGGLDDTFHSYDIVKSVNVHTYSKRSVEERLHTKELTVSAFGQNFTIELRPAINLFSRDFAIRVVDENGKIEEISNFNKNTFHTGRVRGEVDSRVSLHIDDDEVVTGTFTAHGEEITLEPLSNYAEDENADQFDPSMMVAYRKSDIKTDSHPMCGSIHPDLDEDIDEVEFHEFKAEPGRTKRNTHIRNTCHFYAVADYKYFSHMGGSNIFTTANHIVNIISYVNQIYRNTGFSVGSGYGFEISRMLIHTGASTGSDASTYPYNVVKNSGWGTAELLEAFGQASTFKGHCLAKLFTANQMPDSVLGLAYIASSRVGSAGGICSPTRTYNGQERMYNTAWSSSRNGAGGTVTFIQQALVTAHEFGHNWGSEHDPSGDTCSPGTILGDGKYLMYAYSVTGEDPNNDEFSSCSKNYINGVLNNKAASCFQAASVDTTCGNGRIDSGEECDGGLLSSLGIDNCCDQDCTLRAGATCSPSNKACCTTQCLKASTSMVCRGDREGTCQQETFCDFDCPVAENKVDGTDCIDQGSCYQGICKPFCEYRNLNSCVCDTVDNSCKRCCRDLISKTCTVYVDTNTQSTEPLADGRSCVQGYCQSGVCQKVETDLVARLWDLIDSISIDFIIESFKTNMVACVTGFSLVLYIPICIIVWCIDKKRKSDWKKENSVHVRTDRGLAHDEDKRPIGNSEKPTSGPSRLDASALMDNSYRRPNSRNQIQPLGRQSASSQA